MPRVPLPHILTEPKYSNGFQLRFVQLEDVMEGELLFEHSHVQENLNNRKLEPVYRTFVIKEIKEKRPARGDWPDGDKPLYFDCIAEYLGLRFKSALDVPVNKQ